MSYFYSQGVISLGITFPKWSRPCSSRRFSVANLCSNYSYFSQFSCYLLKISGFGAGPVHKESSSTPILCVSAGFFLHCSRWKPHSRDKFCVRCNRSRRESFAFLKLKVLRLSRSQVSCLSYFINSTLRFMIFLKVSSVFSR